MKQVKRKGNIVKPSAERYKRRRRAYLITAIWIICIAGFIWLLSYLSHLSGLSIKSINVEGTLVIDEDKVRREVLDEISGSYLKIFSKRNIFLFPKQGIMNILKSDFTRIEELRVSLSKDSVLTVTIHEREGRYLWCRPASFDIGGKEECFFADSHGYIFSSAPYFSDNLYLKIYGPLFTGSSENPIGGRILSEDEFTKLVRFQETLTKIGLESHVLILAQSGDYEFDLDQKGNGGMPRIIFKKGADYQALALDLDSALSNKPLMSEFKEKYGSLLYLDLRFPNKVLYKFRE